MKMRVRRSRERDRVHLQCATSLFHSQLINLNDRTRNMTTGGERMYVIFCQNAELILFSLVHNIAYVRLVASLSVKTIYEED